MTQATVSGRALSTGIATAALLLVLAGAAEAQEAYYFPQAGNGPVTVNYGALTPYAAPGYQPYGTAPYGALTSQPRSVFTPQAVAPAYQQAPAYGVPAYTPVYAAPSSRFLPGQITNMPTGQPAMLNPITYNAPVAQPPFIAPYGNPAYAAQMQGQMSGLPTSTPQSYLNVPGQAPVALMGVPQPGAKPFDPNNLKPKKSRKTAAAAAPAEPTTAVEEAAAAQVAAVEAQLESGPAPGAPLPAPTPPEAPAEIPANVPSPAASADVAAAAAPVAPAAAATSVAETVPAEAATIEPPAEGSSETQTAAVEPEAAPAEEAAVEETPADTGGAAALPAGGTRIVFEPGADELPAGASSDLDALAQRMASDESIKVQVLAYSTSTGDNESQARRKALSRGLEVRKYLINKGVRSNRIDVRALGSKSEGSPADRVDIVPAAG
jgi:outer membrane protein OmpA-like peptidoglycan-associated protein